MFGGQFREVHRYEEVFFLFCIDKLDEPALDKGVDIDFFLLKAGKILNGDEWFAILQDDERASGTAPVGKDDNIAVVFLVRDI